MLERAVRFVKPGGRIAYITCSLLPQENGARVKAFLECRPDWRCLRLEHILAGLASALAGLASSRSQDGTGLLLTPARTGTDGFFLSVLERIR